MEEFFGFLVAVVAGIAYGLVACVVAVAGTVAGGVLALERYARMWSAHTGPEHLPLPPAAPPEPAAVRGYFFGKAYDDWRQALRATYAANGIEARQRWDAGRAEPLHLSKGVFPLGLAAGQGATTGPMMVALAAVLYGLGLLVVSLVIGIVTALLRLVEQASMLVRRYACTCPRCHARVPLPVYLCPGCSTGHARLLPSTYGAWRHRCRCGTRLPALMVLDRGALRSRCPDCDYTLSREHTEAAKICVPILGTTSSGKTALAFALCHEIRHVVAPAQGLETRFLSAEAEHAWRAAEGTASRGRAPDKTVDRVPHALDLVLERADRAERVIYLYDPAGEAYSNDDYLAQHRFLAYPTGFLLVLDPFGFEPLARQVGQATLRQVRASQTDPDEVASNVLNMIEKNFGLSPKALLHRPLAVVVNKIDAAGLDGLIGEQAIAHAQSAAPQEPAQATRDRVIREHLLDWGQAALVQQLESRFRRIGYFAVSALGRCEDGSAAPMRPRGVLLPFAWLLAQAGESWQPVPPSP